MVDPKALAVVVTQLRMMGYTENTCVSYQEDAALLLNICEGDADLAFSAFTEIAMNSKQQDREGFFASSHLGALKRELGRQKKRDFPR